MDLGRVGVWSRELRGADAGEAAEAAAELEELGFGAVWIPGGSDDDVLDAVSRVLDATEEIVVATGILNVWVQDPDEVAAERARIAAAHPGRFLLGLGISHAGLIDVKPGLEYRRPLQTMAEYLDRLDAATPPVFPPDRVLAALGPKMLELARDRTAGAHPYLVNPDHTAYARKVLGPRPLLAPDQKVVLSTDPAEARAIARGALERYLKMPNYTRNLLRTGYSEEDLAGGGTDRLVDGLVAWGNLDAIASRVAAHLEAGADHVCLNVQTGTDDIPLSEWRELASLVGRFS